MRGVIAVLGGGAAAQDVELGAFFHHHDVVHGLPGGIALDEHAGLHGLADLHALAGAHEVAAVEVFAGHAGDLVLVGIEQLPVILRQAVEFLEGRADVHEFQAFLPGGAVHVGVVELHEGAADLVVVHVDAGQDQALLVFPGQAGQASMGAAFSPPLKLKRERSMLLMPGEPPRFCRTCRRPGSAGIPGSRAGRYGRG